MYATAFAQAQLPSVWYEATSVVTGVIAATVVMVTTVVASCPAGAERTAAMAGGEATRQASDGHLGEPVSGTTIGGRRGARKNGGNGVMELENQAVRRESLDHPRWWGLCGIRAQ